MSMYRVECSVTGAQLYTVDTMSGLGGVDGRPNAGNIARCMNSQLDAVGVNWMRELLHPPQFAKPDAELHV